MTTAKTQHKNALLSAQPSSSRNGRNGGNRGNESKPQLRQIAVASKASVIGAENLAQRIYETVFDSVMGQRLLPGTKLPESSLCELFGVGRTTVQKALQMLAHDHIIEMRPNRGAIVAMPTPEETSQIFEARRALEAATVSLAVKNATKTDLAGLRRQLQEEQAAMHSYAQTDWARLASIFHLRVAALARNPILERYLTELLSRCSLIVALHEPAGHASCEHDEHGRIVDAIAKGDAVSAAAAMEEHLIELERHIHLVSKKPRNSLAEMLGMN